MLSEAEKREWRYLLWLHRYYLDCWLATMKALDTLRPSVERIHETEVGILAKLKNGEIGLDEAERLNLTMLRDWLSEYREMAKTLSPMSPN